MRPAEPRSFETQPLIDRQDALQVDYWCKRLEVSAEDIDEAVRAVGPNRTAVAIWLGRPEAL
ncbi:MAG: DUF3606 domain-containing protein [Phenylobacterium sp.]|uniref:DUF3606 domain-containing protein n=1 Tax=Phenylobacterium sp. TaxID=1871053 RepID=UPI00273435D3|nr:DUF3606 domain-containing protein [Phenylobacterium sp.]MDP3175778.1 DUF3606 domain-containing protein [Phenylobacterium sp.]